MYIMAEDQQIMSIDKIMLFRPNENILEAMITQIDNAILNQSSDKCGERIYLNSLKITVDSGSINEIIDTKNRSFNEEYKVIAVMTCKDNSSQILSQAHIEIPLANVTGELYIVDGITKIKNLTITTDSRRLHCKELYKFYILQDYDCGMGCENLEPIDTRIQNTKTNKRGENIYMKIISIEVGRNGKFVMEFVNGHITKSIQLPDDYALDDLAQIVYENCMTTIMDTKIVCDKYGCGLAFWDSFNAYEKNNGKLTNITKIDTIFFPTNNEHQVRVAKFISDNSYIKKIYKLFKNSEGQFSELECDKLIDDIGKMSYETSGTGRIMIKANRCKNEMRVYCLLQVIALDLCEGLKCV